MHERKLQPSGSRRIGFTLIELLVVITIIVVLLALLAPALDKAIYQADLAVCAAELRAVGSGAITYAHDHRRRYPHRPMLDDPEIEGSGVTDVRPYHLTYSPLQYPHLNPSGYDDRPTYRPYFPLNALMCPLTDDVDLDTPDSIDSTIWVSRPMWFGWKYTDPAKGGAGMMRVGDRFTWDGERFNTLAGDVVSNIPFATVASSSHPDSNGVASLKTMDHEDWNDGANGKLTMSFYDGGTLGTGIGTYDPAYVRDDGSVQRYEKVFHDGQRGTGWDAFRRDERVRRVALHPKESAEDPRWSRLLVPRGQ